MIAEVRRLAEDATREKKLETLGPLSSRAAVGHRAGGLFAARHGWDYFPHDHAAGAPIAGVRTACWASRSRMPALLRAGAVERKGPMLKERLFGLTGPQGITGRMSRSATFTSTPHPRIPT